ncbi:MAG: LysR substrate-binding domain-containing protein [Coriobacteriia bacterium]|nr:LysR substrate-binding domain-containing protein [Coriobacteriia bacterium]
MLNVNRLKMLRDVAARGTIAAAAEGLLMSSSAVSQQMAVLEREAGVPLLERHGRGVRLTDAGVRLVHNTERVLAALEQAEADLVDSSRGIVGHLRVSAFPSAARTVLVPALVEIGAAHPNLRISMVDLEPEEAIPALKSRAVDVALTYEWDLLPTLEDEGVEREQLFGERVYLALPVAHPAAASSQPVALATLAETEWIVGRDSTSMLEFVQSATRRVGFEPRTDFHSMDFDVILAAVEAGLGVALVPPLAFAYDLPGVAIREVADLELNRLTWAAIRRGSGETPGIHAVLASLRTHSAAVVARLPGPRN